LPSTELLAVTDGVLTWVSEEDRQRSAGRAAPREFLRTVVREVVVEALKTESVDRKTKCKTGWLLWQELGQPARANA